MPVQAVDGNDATDLKNGLASTISERRLTQFQLRVIDNKALLIQNSVADQSLALVKFIEE